MGTKARVDQGALNRVAEAIATEENFISFVLVVMRFVDGHVGFVRLQTTLANFSGRGWGRKGDDCRGSVATRATEGPIVNDHVRVRTRPTGSFDWPSGL
jgi:hypothetical protein